MKTESIAKVVHELNRAYCYMLGDESQVAWEDAPDWQKESTLQGVEHLLQNPDLSAEEMHENWMEVKEKDGWSYGVVKIPELKEHPCMLPYSELPIEQQRKDIFFSTIVKAMKDIPPEVIYRDFDPLNNTIKTGLYHPKGSKVLYPAVIKKDSGKGSVEVLAQGPDGEIHAVNVILAPAEDPKRMYQRYFVPDHADSRVNTSESGTETGRLS